MAAWLISILISASPSLCDQIVSAIEKADPSQRLSVLKAQISQKLTLTHQEFRGLGEHSYTQLLIPKTQGSLHVSAISESRFVLQLPKQKPIWSLLDPDQRREIASWIAEIFHDAKFDEAFHRRETREHSSDWRKQKEFEILTEGMSPTDPLYQAIRAFIFDDDVEENGLVLIHLETIMNRRDKYNDAIRDIEDDFQNLDPINALKAYPKHGFSPWKLWVAAQNGMYTGEIFEMNFATAGILLELGLPVEDLRIHFIPEFSIPGLIHPTTFEAMWLRVRFQDDFELVDVRPDMGTSSGRSNLTLWHHLFSTGNEFFRDKFLPRALWDRVSWGRSLGQIYSLDIEEWEMDEHRMDLPETDSIFIQDQNDPLVIQQNQTAEYERKMLEIERELQELYNEMTVADIDPIPQRELSEFETKLSQWEIRLAVYKIRKADLNLEVRRWLETIHIILERHRE